MFFGNPLHSKTSQNDLLLSSDIPLSKQELIKIKDKIKQDNIVDTPCWIYIDDKMYLIEKKQSENTSEEQDKGRSKDNTKQH